MMLDNQTQKDVFVYRLVGGIGLALSTILAAWAVHLTFSRIPAMREILVEFDMTLPAATRLAFRVPWLPVAVCSLSVVLGLLAVFSMRRVAIASCWITVLLSLGALALFEYAIGLSFYRLINSMTGA